MIRSRKELPKQTHKIGFNAGFCRIISPQFPGQLVDSNFESDFVSDISPPSPSATEMAQLKAGELKEPAEWKPRSKELTVMVALAVISLMVAMSGHEGA